MDCSLTGSSIHEVLQARILEWVAIPSSRGSSQLRDWTWVSCIVGRRFMVWATREVHLAAQKLKKPRFHSVLRILKMVIASRCLLYIRNYSRCFICITSLGPHNRPVLLDRPKILAGSVCKILWKNPNELIGQPNIIHNLQMGKVSYGEAPQLAVICPRLRLY